MVAMALGIGQWVRSRFGWEQTRDALAKRGAPASSPTPYILAATATAFALQVVSGSLLLLHYYPSAEHAHRSVGRIMGVVPFGGLTRGIHVHSGNLLLALLVLLVVVMVVRRAYVPPRELVWLTGVIAVPLGATLAFTGTLLPWSQDAYFNARVGSRIASYVPLVGEGLEEFLRGGLDVTSATLHRAFAFHVAILPPVLAIVIGLHLLALRAAPRPAAGEVVIPVYPDLAVRLAATVVAVFMAVLALAVLVEPTLGPAANPTEPLHEHLLPAWYLLAPHQLLRVAPPYLLGVPSPKFIGGALTGVLLAILAVPFVDRRGSRVTLGLTIVGLLLATLLTAHALL
jgi:ubiquinol-cytochrome c reductase cytochrome b subunit